VNQPDELMDDSDDPYDWEYEEVCGSCYGEGYYHDCGEDTCCCADPDDDELWACDECGGSGYLR
jgi:hypothetical protein